MKTIAGVLLVAFLAFTASPVSANPSFTHAESGSIRIEENGSIYDIHSSDRAIGAFSSFSNAAGETIRSFQASPEHTALFRVTGGSPSEILGAMSANSRVFLVNPNGVLFGQGSSVNAPGLVASALPISNADFLSGNYAFGAGSAGVVNRGDITAGRYAALVGNTVSNEGTISAPGGAIALVAGGSARLLLDAEGLVSVEMNAPASVAPGEAALSNAGTLAAEGGLVILSARAAEGAFDRVVNHTGVIEANSVGTKNGVVILDGGSEGIVAVAGQGTISAKGLEAGETGGTVQILGEKTGLFDTASVDVSGAAGGGTAYVGGGLRGADPALANASYGYAGPETTLKADAIDSGDGGTVVLWADRTMNFQGRVSARGGSSGGDGGFVEVSGKEALWFSGSVDTRAPLGEFGTLLLDPKNITIDDSGSIVTPPQFFAANATADVSIDKDVLAGQSTNVTLQANNDIVVAQDIDVVMTNTSVALTMQAGRSIILRQGSSLTTTGGVITLTANDSSALSANRDAGAAQFLMEDGTEISSGPGANIVIKMDGGSTSGDIVLNNVSAIGNEIHVQNYGPTSGGDILRRTSTSLLSGSGAILETTSTGGGVGTTSAPMRVSVLELEALAGAGGIYVATTTGTSVGGTVLGTGVTGLTTSSGGDIELAVTGALGFAEAVVSADDLTVTATGDVTLTNTAAIYDIEAGGDISFALTGNDETLSIPASVIIRGLSGTHSYKTDKISIVGQIEATGQTVTLAPNATGEAIDLGSSTDNATDVLELSEQEIQNVSAADLVLGSPGSGNIFISAGITATHTNVGMTTGGTIRDNNSGVFKTLELVLTAVAGIGGGVGTDLDVDAVNIEATTDTGGIHLDLQDTVNDGIVLEYAAANSGDVTIDSSVGTSSKTIDTVLAKSGSVFITDSVGLGIVHTGNITAGADVVMTASNGDVLLDLVIAGDDITVTASNGNDVLDNNGADLNLSGDHLTLIAGGTVGTSADPIEATYNSISITPLPGFVTRIVAAITSVGGLTLAGGRIVGGDSIEDLVTSLYGEEEGAGVEGEEEEESETEEAGTEAAQAEAPESQDVPALDTKTFQPCGV